MRIADRVVAKVAAQAAREALRDGPGADVLPRGRKAAPSADVAVRGGRLRGAGQAAHVRVSVVLGYPSDIGAQCGAVRRRVASRVRELVGMDVPEVAVEVTRLRSSHLDDEGPGSGLR
ncbi:Asp23/Gls24 family envelope stress response protein [Streptomyces oceani]|uniref:Asp23/Gls24 family envelope stress response protein n=1 Tax=Streptomyces oceani TaxID=1075402 RepID=A0A1E7JZ34_9ACTN|nr:Asp23/Gls24 family envelope stress response protein [Streptomyces oceani]OEU96856.1 hypothetical protein AN216_17990 [Streptomyces oceani]